MMTNEGAGQSSRSRDERSPEPKRNRVGSDDGYSMVKREDRSVKKRRSMYMLQVLQQPERARLCSFKEENETIDRRPVDPPPVVVMHLTEGLSSAEPESSLAKYFIRASIVHPHPVNNQDPLDYTPVKTPTGADASAGEVVQTPENLRGLDGKAGKMVIFAKLSVRMPGIFRLMFTLFQTSDSGLTEITHTVSDPFEVFSPKLFKGMRESTALTRHLAAQGLKVKLRTDTSVGRQTDARRRSSVQSNPSSPQPQPPYRPHSDPNRITYQHPHPVHPPPIAIPSPNIPQSSLSAPPRSLVWRDQDPFRRTSAPLHNPVAHMPYHPPPPPPPLSNHGPSAGMIGPSHGSIPGPSHLGPIHLETAPPPRPRFMDDGMPPTLRDLSSPLNWTPSQSSDLAAFSLSQPSSHPSTATVSTSRPSSRHFSPFSTNPSSARSRTSSDRSDSMPTVNDLRIRGQDDGFSILPIFPTQPSVNNLLSSTVSSPATSTPASQETVGSEPPGDRTLPPILRVAELRRPGPGPGQLPDYPRDNDDKRHPSR